MANRIDYNTVLKNVKRLCRKQNTYLGDIEVRAGVSRGYLSRLAKNNSTSSTENMYSIASALGVTIQELIEPNDLHDVELSWGSANEVYLSRQMFVIVKGLQDIEVGDSLRFSLCGTKPDEPTVDYLEKHFGSKTYRVTCIKEGCEGLKNGFAILGIAEE